MAEASQNAEDGLIVAGMAGEAGDDAEMKGMVVSASNVTTTRLQQAKKQAAV